MRCPCLPKKNSEGSDYDATIEYCQSFGNGTGCRFWEEGMCEYVEGEL